MEENRGKFQILCNACNREFDNESQRKLHYKSEWHRYNLKRKAVGAPGVTEALFLERVSALAEERDKSNSNPSTYCCTVCGKEYRSSKAHDQHLRSRSHITKASLSSSVITTIIKPARVRMMPRECEDSDEGSEEWVKVDSHTVDWTTKCLTTMDVDDNAGYNDNCADSMDDEEELNPACCFICDRWHESIENCMVHMHKKHGFFIPDVEYLKDPRGLLMYVGLKVKRDFMCLHCNDRCHPFQSLEAVRKHMIAKGHCKVRYGDGDDDEDVELEEFYDYSSSYIDADGKQLLLSDDATGNIELGNCGSELVMTRKSERAASVTTFGSREFLRYYHQKPRPTPARDAALTVSLASRYKSMGVVTLQSKEQIARRKLLRDANRSEIEAMRSRIGIKSNIVRNIPKNLSH